LVVPLKSAWILSGKNAAGAPEPMIFSLVSPGLVVINGV